jgi:hypothetical protein
MTALPSLPWELLFQIPLAAIVVAVVWIFLKYLEKSEARSQQFIKEQRDANNLSIRALADEISKITTELKGVAIEVVKMDTSLCNHDNLVRDFTQEVRRYISSDVRRNTRMDKGKEKEEE